MANSDEKLVVNLPPIGLVEEKNREFVEQEGVLPYECLVATETDYFFYTCLNDNDRGWGCAYRALQQILSNLLLYFQKHKNDACNNQPSLSSFRTKEGKRLKGSHCVRSKETERWDGIPSILEIQHRLWSIGALLPHQVGTSKWIEPKEACMFLRSWGLNAHTLSFHSNDPRSVQGFKKLLFIHFGGEEGKGWRSPLMIDDTIKAYSVLGVGFSPSPFSSSLSPDSITHILRFDPHAVEYPTGDDDVGWRGAEWMPFERVFPPEKKRTEWFVCFPTREFVPKHNSVPVTRTEIDKEELQEILKNTQLPIDPVSVYSIHEIHNSTCPWCSMKCGHKAVFSPCGHSLCGDCVDGVVDGGVENCPICGERILDVMWGSLE
mmetsp:Transcript_4621/g.6953  ORF Transcript_4621/g.6953 Transcript_4621/m.6953 type:complete len:377 (-) Transcript_4621:146-1276(-)